MRLLLRMNKRRQLPLKLLLNLSPKLSKQLRLKKRLLVKMIFPLPLRNTLKIRKLPVMMLI